MDQNGAKKYVWQRDEQTHERNETKREEKRSKFVKKMAFGVMAKW